jgi:NAD(P)H-dependent FMN reductase
MTQPKILAFAGSTRRDSLNKKLARVAAEAARAAGAEVTLVDLRDLPMPLYDGDLEKAEGIPPNAMRFKELLLAHRGLLVASPEYNSSISGVLKNSIDWASRQSPGEPALACFQDKVCGLLAASPGALGGLRGLVTVRSLLGNLGVIVVPDQLAVGKAHEAFDAEGRLVDAKQRATVERIAKRVVDLVTRLEPRS